MRKLIANEYSTLHLKGEDAFEFGQRMFSRNLKGMNVGEGRLASFLSAEGKVQALFWVTRINTGLQLLLPKAECDRTLELMERYHFAEKFETSWDSSETWSGNWNPVVGPEQLYAEGRWKSSTEFRGVFRGTEWTFQPGSPESLTSEEKNAWLKHRIERLIPEWGLELDTDRLVFDVGLEDICDADKGCYIGQEVVERVRTRAGSGPIRFSALALDGEQIISKDLEVFSREKEVVGKFSGSAVFDPQSQQTLALAFLKRAFVEKSNEVFGGRIFRLCGDGVKPLVKK